MGQPFAFVSGGPYEHPGGGAGQSITGQLSEGTAEILEEQPIPTDCDLNFWLIIISLISFIRKVRSEIRTTSA
jgi:hypothetical protein